jgi:serpin B
VKRLLAVSLILSLLILGCTSKPNPDEEGPAPVKPPAADRATKEDKAAVVQANNAFALDLLGRLDGKENVFFSPAGISTALAMTYAGARGETAEQMAKALHLPADAKHLHPAFAALMWELQGSGQPRGYRLNIANALWGDRTTQFKADFLQTMQDNYVAGLQQVSFAKPEDSRLQINAWIARQTGNRIKDLLKSGDLTPDARLVLTNALYFKGDWEQEFKAEDTREEAFHAAPKEDVSVPMMHKTAEYRFLTNKEKGFQLLEMPYKDSSLAMVVLLPQKGDGLAALEKTLTADDFRMTAGPRRNKVIETMPKFQMTRRLDLGGQLRSMGMKAAFEPGVADFSGASDEKPLFLSKVAHEAWLEVNKKGSEAAAATDVVMAKGEEKPETPAVFRADHPFLFLIRDTRTDMILFLGRMNNPKG